MTQKPRKALTLLGLAKKAGKLSWQEQANLNAIRSGKAKLLLLAGDSGQATAKKYLDKCLFYKITVIRYATCGELGLAIGSSPRAAVAVLDEGFARRFRELLQ
jgi:ribosomal protein L7Ae-like RNA K-turn-binding protein